MAVMSTGVAESKAWYGPSPPPELIDNASSLQLLSQGAEARVWLATIDLSGQGNQEGSSSGKRSVHVGSGINVPQLSNLSQYPSPLLGDESSSSSTSQKKSIKVIVKERLPKKYRHPALDVSLTKSRTKGEARSLIRCNRADVACPNVLAIANWSNAKDEADKTDKQKSSNTSSSCLFIEHVQGCTVRQYFEQRMESSREDNTPSMKRQRRGEEDGDNSQVEFKKEDRITTVIDTHTLSVAYSIGTLVGKMHAAGVIHGDLTTSNIMVTNAPKTSDNQEVAEQAWVPNLILIDFGLATSTNSTIITANSDASSNNKKQHKQQHSAEEKAVDLYVLERAFLSTHPESEQLVEEVLKGYREFFEALGSGNTDGDEKSGGTTYGYVAKAIFNRLEQVRMRGRKRECFG
jgi:TP53 regulating kinase-like protein